MTKEIQQELIPINLLAPERVDYFFQKAVGFYPHDGQEKILKGLKRFNVICAGTRFGKSIFCAYIGARELWRHKKKKEVRIWVVAPTYDLTKKIYNYLVEFLGRAEPELIRNGVIKISDRAGSMKIEWKATNELPYRSWIEFKSAENPTSLLGEELDLIIVDECSRTKKEIWESYLYSRLTSRKGSAIFISTPKGKNWFYHEWVKNNDPENKDGASFRFTSLDNKYFSKEEWDKAKQLLPTQVFKQEHEAAFLDDAASVFRGVNEIATGKLIIPESEEWIKKEMKGHFFSMGVDLGKHEDFTVLTLIDRSSHQVRGFDRFKQLDWGFQKTRIYETAKAYNNARITIDSTGIGDPITDDLRRMGLAVDDFKYTNKSKTQLIEKLSIFIEQKRIYYPNIPELIDELESFGYNITPSGNFKYGAPEGSHDDCVNSLALAVWPLPQSPVKAGDSTPILVNSNIY